MTGQRVGKVLEAAIEIWGERRKRISTGELNRVLSAAMERTPPPPVRTRAPVAVAPDPVLKSITDDGLRAALERMQQGMMARRG